MNIVFNKKNHQYIVDGEIASLSVTQLLRKHGLAPNYSNVKEEVLNAKAELGTYIHAELESIIKNKDYQIETAEGEAFKRYLDKFVDGACAEQMVAYNYQGMIIAGTADVVGFYKDSKKGCFVADHKTTANINKEYVSWQTSILDYMFRHANIINDKVWKWKGADEFLCFHYTKDGDMEVIKLDKIDDSEIEALFEAEYNGKIYQRKQLVLDPEVEMGIEMVTDTLKKLNKRVEQAEAQQKKYKEIILKAMEEQGIKSVECGNLKITYVYPQDKMCVDKDKLKAEYPQVYPKVLKTSHTNAYITITINEDE